MKNAFFYKPSANSLKTKQGDVVEFIKFVRGCSTNFALSLLKKRFCK
jgi:hypothetical protein